jgi:hypothetical protein
MRLFVRRFHVVGGALRFAATLLVFALLSTAPFAAQGNIITVANTNDSGLGSLRQAIADANDGDAIQFDPSLNGQTITLTSGELQIDRDVTIHGPGANLLTVARDQQAPNFRIFYVLVGRTVALEGLTVTGGYEVIGGGIFNGGTLTVSDSVVTANRSGNPTPPPFVTPTPGGRGAGIAQTGPSLQIRRTTISNNISSGALSEGGGVFQWVGLITIAESTINNNHADDGGGFYSLSSQASATITNSSISSNSAGHGGGIFNSAPVSIRHSTISNNAASAASDGGGIYVYGGGALELENTVLKAGASGANISNYGGPVTSHGYNLSSDNGGGFLTGPGDQINTDPLLGPLQNNGGPTLTHMPLSGSPAIDAGDPNFTPPPVTDQRGFLRVYNSRIDIGSFEVQPIPRPTPAPTATSTPTATATATATATPAVTPVTPCPARSPSGQSTLLAAPVGPNAATLLFENFDTVTAPALPPGWSATNAVGPPPLWVTSTVLPGSPPNDAFIDDPSTVSDKYLDTPLIPISAVDPRVSFQNFYNLESSATPGVGLDGAVLEVSSPNINGGAFTDITDPAVGGFFITGGYNATISTSFMNPLAGRMAWSGNSGGYIETKVDLGFRVIGQYIKLRFRMASDTNVAAPGWHVDNVFVQDHCVGESPTPPPPTPTATATATASPIIISGTVGRCTNSGPSTLPLPNVTMTLTGSSTGSTVTDASGNYSFSVAPGGSYTVTPSKAQLSPSSSGINTPDVIGIQRYFLQITPPIGCIYGAADCAAPSGVTVGDVIAAQRFFLGFTNGIGNVGKYKFDPVNRSYSSLVTNQSNQNYDTVVLGDVVAPYAAP